MINALLWSYFQSFGKVLNFLVIFVSRQIFDSVLYKLVLLWISCLFELRCFLSPTAFFMRLSMSCR